MIIHDSNVNAQETTLKFAFLKHFNIRNYKCKKSQLQYYYKRQIFKYIIFLSTLSYFKLDFHKLKHHDL